VVLVEIKLYNFCVTGNLQKLIDQMWESEVRILGEDNGLVVAHRYRLQFCRKSNQSIRKINRMVPQIMRFMTNISFNLFYDKFYDIL
jgi:hypothetical protein